jgi:uncharacterized SAM-binding protein YcdF (DUF218 family)
VWYDFETNKVFPKPIFSFEAFASARSKGPSEAEVIAHVMEEKYGVPEEAIILEDLSATTQESALFVRQILRRPLFLEVEGTDISKLTRVGLLTLLYHMPHALKCFQAADLEVVPVYAEDMLALDTSRDWADEIERYYQDPKGGKQWDAERIRNIMTARAQGKTYRTVNELFVECSCWRCQGLEAGWDDGGCLRFPLD